MSQARHEMTMKRVLYDMPGTRDVIVRKAIEYAPSEQVIRAIDVYYPARTQDALSAVLFVSGFSDVGAVPLLGCRINEMEAYISWARLVAASGLIAVTYSTGVDPAADTRDVIRFLRTPGSELNLDASRLGLWAGSSHAPNALGQLMEHRDAFSCAVFFYPFMLDLDGMTDVADAQRKWRFANPSAGRCLDDLPNEVPFFIARAGRDENPGLNDSIDRFISHALQRNLPITLVNHHTALHAFDILEDTATTRAVVQTALEFVQSRLK